MNTVLSTLVDEQPQNHPPSSHKPAANGRHVSLPDRVALHLGLALITWSRRPRTVTARNPRGDARARNDRALERAARERQWERAALLTQPRR